MSKDIGLSPETIKVLNELKIELEKILPENTIICSSKVDGIFRAGYEKGKIDAIKEEGNNWVEWFKGLSNIISFVVKSKDKFNVGSDTYYLLCELRTMLNGLSMISFWKEKKELLKNG